MSLLATPKSSAHNRKLASRNRAYKREKLNPAIISQGGSRRKTAFMQLYWKLSGEVGSKGGHSHALLAAWGWGVEACCSSGVLTMAAMTTMGCPWHLLWLWHTWHGTEWYRAMALLGAPGGGCQAAHEPPERREFLWRAEQGLGSTLGLLLL